MNIKYAIILAVVFSFPIDVSGLNSGKVLTVKKAKKVAKKSNHIQLKKYGKIPEFAFFDRQSIKTVSLENVVILDNDAFTNCLSLESVVYIALCENT